MSEKLYKLEEVLEMEGSEFTARDGSPVKCINGVLNIYCRKDYQPCGVSKFWLNNEYKLVKKPVTFNDVLESNKKCRIEHKQIDLIMMDVSDNLVYQLNKEHFTSLSNILKLLGDYFNDTTLKEIIKESKWYLEE